MRQSKKTNAALRCVGAIAIGGALLASGLRAQQPGAEGCSNQTFQGLYGLSVEGVVFMPDEPDPAPFQVAGLMQADGAGALTVFRQVTNVGGSVLPIDWAAAAQPAVQYSVNPDCTATIEFFVPGDSGIPIVPPDGLPFSAAIVLVNDGREAIGIQTSPPNAVLTVRLKRTDALDGQLQAAVDNLAAEARTTAALLRRVAMRLGLVP